MERAPNMSSRTWLLCVLIFVPAGVTVSRIIKQSTDAKCPRFWVDLHGYCYKVFKADDPREKKTQGEALSHCRSQGADLVSYHSLSEVLAVNRQLGWRRDAWIGLFTNNTVENDRWTDGTKYDFKKWKGGQPSNHNGQENCVEHSCYNWNGGEWEHKSCHVRLDWICKMKRGDPWIPPTTPVPTAYPDKHCGADNYWVYFKGDCYLVEPHIQTDWYYARDKCMKAGGDLASINDGEINGLLTSMASKYGVTTLWIGLNFLDRGQYRWSDGTPSSYFNWAQGQPDDKHYGQLCVNLHSGSGAWNDDNCADQLGYICKKRNGTLTPKPVPMTSPIPGFCPPGYYGTGNKCFRVYGIDGKGMINFDTAVMNCRSQGVWYDLASVNSPGQQAVINALIGATAKVKLWLGLTNRMFGRLQWLDNSPLSYLNWDRYQPHGVKYCANVQVNRTNFGTWALTDCQNKKGYICEYYKRADQVIPTSAPYPWNECQAGYTPYARKCYKVIGANTWSRARGDCRNDRGYLASIQNIAENSFVAILLSSVPGPVWIGLSVDQQRQVYSWDDFWPVRFTNWDQGNDGGPGRECVAMLTNGRWNGTECFKKYPALCRKTKLKPPPTEPNILGKCLDASWNPFLRHCYRASTPDKQDFSNSFVRCSDFDSATLLSVHSVQENGFVLGSLILNSDIDKFMWLGLRRKSKDYPWMWYDGTELEYENWDSAAEATNTGRKDCAAMDPSSGTWKAKYCSDVLPYACKRLKDVITTNSPPPGGLTVGAKVGIVFGVLGGVVLILVIITVVLKRTDRLPPIQIPQWTHKLSSDKVQLQHDQ